MPSCAVVVPGLEKKIKPNVLGHPHTATYLPGFGLGLLLSTSNCSQWFPNFLYCGSFDCKLQTFPVVAKRVRYLWIPVEWKFALRFLESESRIVLSSSESRPQTDCGSDGLSLVRMLSVAGSVYTENLVRSKPLFEDLGHDV